MKRYDEKKCDGTLKVLKIVIKILIIFAIVMIIDFWILGDNCIVEQEGYLSQINTKDEGELILVLDNKNIVDGVSGSLDGYQLGEHIQIVKCKTKIFGVGGRKVEKILEKEE